MEKSEIETIYRKYFHDVFLYIRALSENESLAEEITQETFLKAMNNIEKFAIRQHWSIGNNLHWQLDVTFREDYSKKVKNAAGNFSVATKMALTTLKNEKTTKGSMNLKRLNKFL